MNLGPQTLRHQKPPGHQTGCTRKDFLRGLAACATLSLPLAIPSSQGYSKGLIFPSHFPKGWQNLRPHLYRMGERGFLRDKSATALALGGQAYITAGHNQLPAYARNILDLRIMLAGKDYALDVKLFCLPNKPGLPHLPLARQVPVLGSHVLHGGFGYARNEVSLLAPGVFAGKVNSGGYTRLDGRPDSAAPLLRVHSAAFQDGAITAFSTRDSGGMLAAYNERKSRWELLGLLVATVVPEEQDLRRLQNPKQGQSLEAVAIDLTHPALQEITLRYQDLYGEGVYKG